MEAQALSRSHRARLRNLDNIESVWDKMLLRTKHSVSVTNPDFIALKGSIALAGRICMSYPEESWALDFLTRRNLRLSI